MNVENRIILPITPRSWVLFRSGKGGDAAYWFIPLVCTCLDKQTGDKDDEGKPCDEYEATGYCKHTLSKKARQNKANIERYNKYRLDLFHLAKHYGFQIPTCGLAVYFHFPTPIRWPKKKKLLMHGQLKLSKPDVVNLKKGFEDALADKDENIAQYSGAGKFWFHPDMVEEQLRAGYVEILINQPLYNPYNVTFIDQYKFITMEDLEVRREKRKVRREEIRAAKKNKKEQEKKTRANRKVKPLRLANQKALFKKKEKLK